MRESIGQYRIIEELGRGGMGVVYKAHDPSLDRPVAIKVLGGQLAEDDEYVKRFVREAQAAAALNHPNIVQIHGIGDEEGLHYFVMEYVDGPSVQERLRKGGPMSEQEAAEIILGAARGLGTAHDRGIIHRDIKPANLMIDRSGLVKIADFGLALRPTDQTRITSTGLLMGTPGYLAPEQCLESGVDRRTDIYALGVTLFEMLAGRAPFSADSPAALIRKIVDGDLPDPEHALPGISHEMRRIVSTMMHRDPDQRYQTCDDLIADLQPILGSLSGASADAKPPLPPIPIGTAPTTPTPAGNLGGVSDPQPTPPGNGRRTAFLVLAILLLALLGTAGAGVVAWKTGMLRSARDAIASRVPFLQPGASETDAAGAVVTDKDTGAVGLEAESAELGTNVPTFATPTPRVGEAQPLEVAESTGTEEPTEDRRATGDGTTQTRAGPRVTAGEPHVAELGMSAEAGEQPSGPVTGNRADVVSETGNARAQSTAVEQPVPVPPTATPRPTGVVVVDLGEPLLGGAIEAMIERGLSSRGVPLVEEAAIGGIRPEMRPRQALDELSPHAAFVVLIHVELVGQRELRYLGRRTDAWTSDVTVAVHDTVVGELLTPPCKERIEYTKINTERNARKALGRCARRVAGALAWRGR